MNTYNINLTNKIINSGILYPDIFRKMPADMANYLDYFDLPYNGVQYDGGYLKIGKHSIFTQTFTPKDYQKTAFLFHGYFDHSGYFSKVVDLLIKLGIRVVAWDQMGFGLSKGKRGFCNSFEEYVEIAEFIINKFEREEGASNILIGHSAGCSQIFSLILDRKISQQDKIVLIAPLIHCINWRLTVASTALFGHVLRRLPRILRRVSSDKDFVLKLKNDHLEDKWVNVAWPKAMIKWEKTLSEIKTPIIHTLVLQGDLDATVSWRNNLKWLEEKFPNLEKIEIKGGRHHLHNESPKLLKLCIDAIEKFLK